MRRSTTAAVALTVLFSSSAIHPPQVGANVLALRGLTFSTAETRAIFENYVAFLAHDPDRFASHLSTIRQLQVSEIHYQIVLVGRGRDGIEGRVTTDGQSVFIHITHVGGPDGEVASINSRLAHELEHARQFDSGEIGFSRNSSTGRWGPVVATYDIGDDVKAWEAQLVASIGADFFDRDRGSDVLTPSLLRHFADADGFEARAAVLMTNGYGDLRPVVNSNVMFAAKARLPAGTVVHPGLRANYFGRVYGERREVAKSTVDSGVAGHTGLTVSENPAGRTEEWR